MGLHVLHVPADLCLTVCHQADPVVVVTDTSAVVISSNRLQEGSVPALEQGMVVGQLGLADALIIGNCNNQVGRLLLLY